MRIFYYLFILIIISLGLTFAVLNSAPVAFNYYLGTKQIALSLLMISTLGAGIIIGFIFALSPWLKAKKESRALKAKLKNLEQEVSNLRTLPLKGA
jgi:lipopolysaccharide assembly protein A